MTENTVKRPRGRQRDILTYFYENPHKDITINQLEKAFKGRYDRTQIMATMAHVCNEDMRKKYSYPVDRITAGVWRLTSGQTSGNNVTPDRNGEPQQPEGDYKPIISEDMMLVEVLKEKANYILVEDTNDGKIYKMILVG